MDNRAIFLDRDGTINIEKQYLHSIEDFEFIDGALCGLEMLQNAGFILIIITNQSGIGRGYYTEQDFIKLNDWMIKELRRRGIIISRVYYCPHLPDAPVLGYRKKCNCRKPALGMYEQAIKDWDITLSSSYTIGDKLRDCHIAEVTDCKGILISNNEDKKTIERVKKGVVRNVIYRKTLIDAAKYIIGREEKLKKR